MRDTVRRATAVMALGIVATVCSEATGTSAPASVAAASSETLTGTAGAAVATPPSVKVMDAAGNGIAGITVTFAVATGGGAVTGSSQTSGADGTATVGSWTLGTVAGSNTMTATVSGLTAVLFTAQGSAGPPAKLGLTTAPPASVQNRIAWATQPVVQVQDQFGNAASQPGVAVTASATVGTMLGAATTTADANGRATFTNLAIGTTVGSRAIDFQAANLTKTTATVAVTAGAASKLALTTPASVTAPSRVKLSPQPAVQLQDADGNVVSQAGVTVTAAVTSGGGTLSGTTSGPTSAAGVATLDFAVGGVIGAKTVELTAPALDKAAITVTITAGASAAVVALAGNAQTATVGTALPTALSVRVDDADGNVVPDVGVTFAVSAGGGSVSGATATTNALGVAALGSWTLGTTAGANGVSASVAGATPAAFTATGTAGAAVSIVSQAGTGQSAVVATNVAVAPAVKVLDAFGNGVAGVAVTFAVTGGLGQVVGGSATTNAAGIASPTSWTLGTLVGTYGVTASVASPAGLTGSPVSFTATATHGLATKLAVTRVPTDSVMNRALIPLQPIVQLQDVYGNPVLQSGTTIAAAITAGGGSLDGATSISTTSGGAASFSNLALRGIVGPRTVTYTSTGLTSVTSTFHVIAGLTATVSANLGNGQTQPFTTELADWPTVQLADADGNAVAGDTVLFTVTGGAGWIEGSKVVSNAQGFASSGAWTLGPLVGTNTVTATVLKPVGGGVGFTGGTGSGGSFSGQNIAGNPVLFTATATEPASCAVITPLPLDQQYSYQPNLNDSSCRHSAFLPFLDKYSLTTTEPQTFFSLTFSASNNHESRSYMWPAVPSAFYFSFGVGTIMQYFILVPGTYQYEAMARVVHESFGYTLTTVPNPPMPGGCLYAHISQGVTLAHSLDTFCDYTKNDSTSGASKRYLLYVPANATFSMTMTSADFDPFIEVYTVSSTARTFNTSDDNSGGGTTASVSIAPLTFGRYYEIRATNAGASPATGAFTLVVNP